MFLFIRFITIFVIIISLFILVSFFRFRSSHTYNKSYVLPHYNFRRPAFVNQAHSLEISFRGDVNNHFIFNFFRTLVIVVIALFILLLFVS